MGRPASIGRRARTGVAARQRSARQGGTRPSPAAAARPPQIQGERMSGATRRYLVRRGVASDDEGGVAPSAPSITSHPSNQSVTVGATATFSVTASGTAPLTYQWQRNLSNIVGATSTSYTTEVLAIDDDGDTFRCVVTNAYGSATSNSATLNVDEAGASAYEWYPSLDLNDVPFHASAGAWGPQYTVQVAVAPTAPTAVSVATFAAFETAFLAGERTITLTADIDGNEALISGSTSDIDINLNGHVLRSMRFGGASNTCQRIRFRGGATIGTHYPGSQLHNVWFFDGANDIILDGLDGTGPARVGSPLDASTAFSVGGATGTRRRLAVTRCRFMAGCEGYIGECSDTIVTGCSFYTGAETPRPVEDEAWAWRLSGGVGAHIFYDNDIRGVRFHRIRMHPDGSSTYLWIDSNVFVDRVESRILTCDASMVSSPVGDLAGFWATNNETWATGGSPSWYSNDSAYVNFSNNVFHSDTFTGDANLTASGYTTFVRAGNTFGALTADPSWGGPGSPLGLNWDIGA